MFDRVLNTGLSCFSLLLTFSGRRSLSYRNQSIDLYSKSMDWFLHDRDLLPERGKNFCKIFSQVICFFLFDCKTYQIAVSLFLTLLKIRSRYNEPTIKLRVLDSHTLSWILMKYPIYL